MIDDIRKVKPLADVVILCIHWGVHFVPATVAIYQKEVGYDAINAGADLILGSHAHILKGIEVYEGKVIFYSLCNFVMSARRVGPEATFWTTLYGIKEDPEYPFPADSRKTIIAKCIIADKKIAKVSYLPVMINKRAQPEILPPLR